MTMWVPELDQGSKPLYLAIANALSRDVDSGILAAEERLPTHRELARLLGVTVGTVTRGYGEAERRGLVSAVVGRGTFVRGTQPEPDWGATGEAPRADVDLSLSLSPVLEGDQEALLLSETLRRIAAEKSRRLLDYNSLSALPSHRAAGAKWISKRGLKTTSDQVIVTAGVQHGLTVVLTTLLRSGDLLATEELTYPGIKALARMLGLRLQGLAIDDQGVVPEAFEQACSADPKPSALYCVPTLHNPTGGVMSEERRRRIAALGRRHQVLIIEDDVHALLPSKASVPLAAFAPRDSLYLTSSSKALTTGLRTGFLRTPSEYRERLLAGVRSTIWMAPPLMTEVTVRWLEDGTARRLVQAKRAEITARREIAEEVLEGLRLQDHPDSLSIWLHLPPPWRSDELAAQARQRGVIVAGAEAFAVGRRPVPPAVRISLGLARNRGELRRGLEIVREILHGSPGPFANIL